jgi:hypothetical protein
MDECFAYYTERVLEECAAAAHGSEAKNRLITISIGMLNTCSMYGIDVAAAKRLKLKNLRRTLEQPFGVGFQL